MTISLSDLLSKEPPFLKRISKLQEKYLEGDPEEIISYTSIPTGFTDLDKLCGLEKYGINVIASRPAMGKTALALDIALNIAINKKQGNLDKIGTIRYINYDSRCENMLIRMIANRSEIEGEKIRKGALDDKELQRATKTVSTLRKLDFKFLDELPRNEESVLEFIETECKEGDVIFIDYINVIINNIRPEPYTSGVDFVRHLKILGSNKKITIVILSQLSKKIEERAGHRPMLNDLPYGVLADHADNIIFLLRREYYDPLDKPGMAELIVAKNRNNITGCMNLSYNKEFVKFGGYAPTKYTEFSFEEKKFSHFAPN
jgi:replicative DNA helicase